MTQLNDENLKKVERALTEAHRSRQEPSLGADWTLRVMRDIRRETAGHGQSMIALGLDRLVWRTAAVAAVLALVFTGSSPRCCRVSSMWWCRSASKLDGWRRNLSWHQGNCGVDSLSCSSQER